MGLIQPFNFPIGSRAGIQLRRIVQASNPFTEDRKLKPKRERFTLLAPNSNFPNTLQTEAFAQAAAV